MKPLLPAVVLTALLSTSTVFAVRLSDRSPGRTEPDGPDVGVHQPLPAPPTPSGLDGLIIR
jgi:hypothetical protein